jgi:hypothetical protein
MFSIPGVYVTRANVLLGSRHAKTLQGHRPDLHDEIAAAGNRDPSH